MSVAAASLITLAQAKDLLEGYPTSGLDSVAEGIIDAVSVAFDRYLGRTLAKTTYTAIYLDGNGQRELWLPNGPVSVLTTLYEDDTLLTEGINKDFMLYAGDAPSYLARVVKAGGVWLEGYKTLKATLTAGFVVQGATLATGETALPADIAYACKMQVAVELQRRSGRTWNLSSTSFQGGSINRYETSLTKEVKDLLAPYRSFHV